MAVDTFEPSDLEALPAFRKRVLWFYNNRRELMEGCTSILGEGDDTRFLLSVVNLSKLPKILEKMFDTERFLSPFGIRSMSKFHEKEPFVFDMDGQRHSCGYEPGDAVTSMFGGNSNWRGPIWFPINYLLVESLQKYHHFLKSDFKMEYPSGSGDNKDLWEISCDLSNRLINIFRKDPKGKRPVFGTRDTFNQEEWDELIPYYEFFHGDTGEGLGASHQTGWTGLVAKLILQQAEYRKG
jgi:hypothetical protein